MPLRTTLRLDGFLAPGGGRSAFGAAAPPRDGGRAAPAGVGASLAGADRVALDGKVGAAAGVGALLAAAAGFGAGFEDAFEAAVGVAAAGKVGATVTRTLAAKADPVSPNVQRSTISRALRATVGTQTLWELRLVVAKCWRIPGVSTPRVGRWTRFGRNRATPITPHRPTHGAILPVFVPIVEKTADRRPIGNR